MFDDDDAVEAPPRDRPFNAYRCPASDRVKSIIADVTAPLNAEQTQGRGLLLIHSVMDEVAYNETGNEITMIKKRSGDGHVESP